MQACYLGKYFVSPSNFLSRGITSPLLFLFSFSLFFRFLSPPSFPSFLSFPSFSLFRLISFIQLETLIASKHLDKYLNDLQTLQYPSPSSSSFFNKIKLSFIISRYEEINSKWKEGKEDIMKVYYAGREDERYLTSHRFSLLSLPSLADFRAFLLHEGIYELENK